MINHYDLTIKPSSCYYFSSYRAILLSICAGLILSSFVLKSLSLSVPKPKSHQRPSRPRHVCVYLQYVCAAVSQPSPVVLLCFFSKPVWLIPLFSPHSFHTLKTALDLRTVKETDPAFKANTCPPDPRSTLKLLLDIYHRAFQISEEQLLHPFCSSSGCHFSLSNPFFLTPSVGLSCLQLVNSRVVDGIAFSAVRLHHVVATICGYSDMCGHCGKSMPQ